MPDIASLFISVSADVGSAITGLTNVDEKVNGTASAMAAAAPAGYALAGAATAIGGAFLSSVNVAADFEHQMSGVKAVLAPDEVNKFGDALTQLALTLGQSTTFTSKQAALAIEELVKAGVDVQTVLDGGAAAALSLAAATGTDVRQAAEFAGTALNTFHESADQLAHTVDVLTGVSNASAAGINDLQFAFAAVGPVAASIGLSFDDTATALGVFADNGLKGSDAGTSLKTMLLNLEPNTKSSTAAFQQLGLITADGANQFFDASGKAKSMSEIFEILKTSTAGLSDEQKTMALQTAFGTDAVRAALIAASAGADGFNTLSAKVQITGLAATEAHTRLDNLDGDLQNLGGNLEKVQINIGSLFLPALRGITEAASGVVAAFLNLDPSTQGLIAGVVGVAGAVAGLLGGFILLGPVFASTIAGFGIIAGAVAAAALPLVGIAVAAALLYAAWQDDFGGIREVTEQVWAALQPAFQNIINFVGVIRDNLGPAFAQTQSTLDPFIAQLSQALGPILARLPDLVRAIGDGFNALSPVFQAFIGFLRSLDYTGVLAFFIGISNAVAQFFDAVNKLLSGDFSGAWDSFWHAWMTLLQTVFTANVNILSGIVGAVGNFLQQIPGLIAQNAPGMWQAFLDELQRLPDQIGPIFRAVQDAIAPLLGDVLNLFLQAFQQLPSVLQPAWDAFVSWFGGVLGGLPQFVADVAGDVWAFLRTVFENLPSVLQPAWEAFAGWLAPLLAGIPQFVADNMGDVFSALGTAFNDIVTVLAPLWDAFAGWFGSVLGGLPQFVIDNAGDVFGGIVQAATDLVGRIAGAIDPIRELIANTFGNIGNWVASGGTPTPAGGDTGGTPPASGGAPTVTIGPNYISSESDMQNFLDLVAQAVLASSRRVTVPTAGGNPVLG